MKKLLLILILSINAIGVTLSDYCTPNDGLDDAPCTQTAVNDVINGGTVTFDKGIWNFEGTVSFINYTHQLNSIVVKGEKDSVIKPDHSGIIFYVGTQNQITFDGLIFVGDGVSSSADASYVFYIGSGMQARVRNCQFFGVKATAAVYVTDNDLVISDTLFYGSAGTSIVEASNAKGLTVENSEFLDYGNYNGTYYSKTPNGVGSWIKASATSHPTANAMANRGIKVSNVRFDEGAQKTMVLTNLRYAQIESIMVNVSGIGTGAGIVLDNVRLAKVDRSFFGYSGAARPALVLTNNSKVKAEGITLGASVFLSAVDGTSDVDCDEC